MNARSSWFGLARSIVILLSFFLNPCVTFADFGHSGSVPSTRPSEFSGDPNPLTSIPSDLATPWTTSARPWLLAGAAATTVLWILEDRIDDPIQKEANEDRPLGKFSKVGDYGGKFYPNAIYSVGMLSYGLFANDQLALDRSLLMFKASTYAILITSGLKRAVSEHRPGNPIDTQSFPSGHATSAFAFAAFIAAEHPLPYGILAFALATLTGLSRINDNKHYLHDVVGGATIGTAYGLGVSAYHAAVRRERNSGSERSGWQMVPIFSSVAKGAALVGEF